MSTKRKRLQRKASILVESASECPVKPLNVEEIIKFMDESVIHAEFRNRKGPHSIVKPDDVDGIDPAGLLTRYYQFFEHESESNEFPINSHQRRGGGYMIPVMCTIRDALLNRDWETAGLAVYHLVNRLNDCIPFFWHIWWSIVVEVAYSHPDATKASFDQMLRRLKTVTAKDVMEILLNQLHFLIGEGRVDEAMRALSEDMAIKCVNKDDRYHLMTTRVAAAEGVIHYAFWKRKLAQMRAIGGVTSVQDRRELEMYAIKAGSYFQNVLETPGPWDVCVRYFCEIWEEQGDFGLISQMLDAYIETNPDHVNAYKFRYYFQKDREPDGKKQLIATLKKVARLNPYDDLVFDLCLLMHERVQRRIRKNKSLKQRRRSPVEYLFDILDSEITNHREDYWRLLLCFMEEGIYTDRLEAAWKERESWWPNYHFRPSSVEYGASRPTLFFWKAMCSVKLMGKNNLFVWTLLDANVLDAESKGKLQSFREGGVYEPVEAVDLAGFGV